MFDTVQTIFDLTVKLVMENKNLLSESVLARGNGTRNLFADVMIGSVCKYRIDSPDGNTGDKGDPFAF